MIKPQPRSLPLLTALTEKNVSLPNDEPLTEAGDQECQVCFESGSSTLPVCGSQCATKVCVSCLEQHIRVGLNDTIPGILPRVRCPGCLERLPSSAWATRVSSDLSLQYRALCEKACSYLPPCCHNEQYTQLPEPYVPEDTLTLEEAIDPSLHYVLPPLQRRVAQFEGHEITARELIQRLDELLQNQEEKEHYRDLLVDDLTRRLHDDERRAALLLAFHSIHKLVMTRCCSIGVCFNCKRVWDANHIDNPNGPCDNEALAQDDVLECRACRVMIVKVQGCSTVHCPCGFSMHWGEELWTRDENSRHLIPVDVYDIEGFRRWDHWRQGMKALVVWQMEPGRVAFRLRQIDELLKPHRSQFRRMVQAFIWWRRFKLALPELESELHETRRAFLLRKLQRSEPFRLAVRAKRREFQWKACLRSLRRIPAYNEENVTAQEEQLLIGLFG